MKDRRNLTFTLTQECIRQLHEIQENIDMKVSKSELVRKAIKLLHEEVV